MFFGAFHLLLIHIAAIRRNYVIYSPIDYSVAEPQPVFRPAAERQVPALLQVL